MSGIMWVMIDGGEIMWMMADEVKTCVCRGGNRLEGCHGKAPGEHGATAASGGNINTKWENRPKGCLDRASKDACLLLTWPHYMLSSQSGRTPLMWACESTDLELMKVLLATGIGKFVTNLEAKDKVGCREVAWMDGLQSIKVMCKVM